ncbi:MAG: gliding motility-associated C-terminal domain-containing protein [Brumimicrobium sp.]
MFKILTLLFFVLSSMISLGQEINYTHSVHHSLVENKGQWPSQVIFKNKMDGGNLWVEQGGMLFQLQDYSMLQDVHLPNKEFKEPITFKEKLVYLKFIDANHVFEFTKTGETDHYYNFFIGNDESKWVSNVRGYEEFTLHNLYDGIDLKYIEQGTHIKYEFIVTPNASPSKIKLQYHGQDNLKINKKGDLIIKTPLGEVIEEKPYVYQIVNGKIVEISAFYSLSNNIVSFNLGEYDKRAELIIDPTLIFGTYNGAISDNFGMTATYGHDGSAYSAGTIYGNAHPMPDPNAYDTQSNMTVVNVNIATTDGFINKYSADGTQLLWATFYGGGNNTQGTDVPHSLICDEDDNIYVFGTTSSTDFPIVNGFQSTFGGGTPFSVTNNGINFGITGTDIYIAKFSANGHTLMGSTYVGGSQNDGVNYIISAGNYNNYLAYDSLTMNYGDQFRGEIMLDSDNNIIVGSCTRSDNFPIVNAFQPTRAGQQDGVIFKLKHDFSELLFSSFYGGQGADAIYSVKVDSQDNIIFGGGTISTNLPVSSGVIQPTYGGGKADGFIAKLSPGGTNLTHATYLGYASYDQVFFVEVNRDDEIYAFGQSNGGVFPVINASYSNPNSSQFIIKLDEDLSVIQNSTVFGSGSTNFDLSPSAFMVDICGNIYTSGWGGSVLLGGTAISGLDLTTDAFQTSTDGFDFYLMALNRDFDQLLYGTYIGGTQSKDHVDGGTSRFDKNGIIYQSVCGGCGGVSDFATTPGAWSSVNMANNCNALTFKFDFDIIPKAEFTLDNERGCSPFVVNLNNLSVGADSYTWEFDGEIDTINFNPTVTFTEPGTYDIKLVVVDSICLITDSMTLQVEVFPEINLSVSSDISLCTPVPITLTADAGGSATTFSWSDDPNFNNVLIVGPIDSVITINDPQPGYYYIKAENNGCEVVDSILVEFTSADISISGETNLCLGDQTALTATSSNPSIQFFDFVWEPSGDIISGQGTSNVVVQPNGNQIYTLTATASNGCNVTADIQIYVSDIDESLVIATVSDTIVPIGEEVTLTAEPSGYSYSWSPPNLVDSPSSQETTSTVEETTVYTVLVSDGICTKSASVLITAYPYICDEPFIFIPNAFTPNGDGENDVLYLRSQIVRTVILRIYDRWGEKVFETDNLHTGWDGTYRGKQLPPDVYDYYLEGMCIDEQDFIIKGNITLIR